MQLELLERPYLSAQELADVARDISKRFPSTVCS